MANLMQSRHFSLPKNFCSGFYTELQAFITNYPWDKVAPRGVLAQYRGKKSHFRVFAGFCGMNSQLCLLAINVRLLNRARKKFTEMALSSRYKATPHTTYSTSYPRAENLKHFFWHMLKDTFYTSYIHTYIHANKSSVEQQLTLPHMIHFKIYHVPFH